MLSQSSLRACIKKQFCAEGRSFVVVINLDIGRWVSDMQIQKSEAACFAFGVCLLFAIY